MYSNVVPKYVHVDSVPVTVAPVGADSLEHSSRYEHVFGRGHPWAITLLYTDPHI